MKTKDRILITVSLWLAVLPFLITVVCLQFLPSVVPIKQLTGNMTTVSKYNNLFTGFFCFVPLAVICIVSRQRRRQKVGRYFYAVLFAVNLLSLVFAGMTIFCVVMQSRTVDVLKEYDYINTVCVVLCGVFSGLGALLETLVPNEILGIKNKKTLASLAVWKKVHKECGRIAIVGFCALGVGAAFLRDYFALSAVGAGMIAFIVFTQLYSDKIYKIYIKKKTEREKKISERAAE